MKKNFFRKRHLIISLIVLMVFALLLSGCGKHQKDEPAAQEEQDPVEEQVRSDEDQAQLDQDIADGYLIVVNKQNSLPEDYKPDDLEGLKYYAEDRSPDARFLRKTAADHFHEMCEAAAADGVEIVSTTAYRSYEFQNQLYTGYVQSKGQEEADRVSARPGTSEHQAGMSADLSTGEIGYVNGRSFGDSAAGHWIAEHCWDYGFIIRYPEGTEDITGYSYEPWHVRYVGMVAAREIHEENITLEEYVIENNIINPDFIEDQSAIG